MNNETLIDDTVELDIDKAKKEAEKELSNINDLFADFDSAEGSTIAFDSSDDEVEEKPDTSLPLFKDNPEGDSRYYQSGKKKGQLKKKYRSGEGAKISGTGYQTKSQTLGGSVLTGAMFLTMVDLIIPLAIAGANNYLSKDKIKPSDLKLQKSQINELAPLCDEVLKQWQISARPEYLLAISMVGIYGLNFFMAKNAAK